MVPTSAPRVRPLAQKHRQLDGWYRPVGSLLLIGGLLAASGCSGADSAAAPDPLAPKATTIRLGGTYSGHWHGRGLNDPAVRISTREPVVLDGCALGGPGHLIEIDTPGADVTVRNCVATGQPSPQKGQLQGRFITALKPSALRVENNRVAHTAGIYINGDQTPGIRLDIRFNDFRNIEGRYSDGKGGFLDGFHRVQFVQLDKVRQCKECRIEWNKVVNEPRRSRVEDNVNIYLSGGTAEFPLSIRSNLIVGAYPAEPLKEAFSGGGIIIDGDAGSAQAASAHVAIEDNSVIGTSNYGIAVASGMHIRVAGNRIVSSGQLAEGGTIASANVGLYLWDINQNAKRDAFHSHTIQGNTIGWMNAKGLRNDTWFATCEASQCDVGPSFPGEVTQRLEQQTIDDWLQRSRQQSVQLGPKN